MSDSSTLKKKCIFIYVNQGFAVRYLLRTGILETLSSNDIDIVIVSHNGAEASFLETFSNKNIKVEVCRVDEYKNFRKKYKLLRIFEELRAYILNGKYDTQTVDDFREIYIYQKGWVKGKGVIKMFAGLLWSGTSYILMHSKLLRSLLIKFECLMYTPNTHNDLFKKYQPDLVIVSALCGFKYNEYFAREAIKNNIPVTCIILSWDNTTGMGMAGYKPNTLVSWTESMKNELIQLHDTSPKDIFIGGVAHFDSYYNNATLTRHELCERLNLDPSKKIIFYATKSPKRFPWGPELISEIANAIDNGFIDNNSQILVRIHPLHYRRSTNGEYVFKRVIDGYYNVAQKYKNVIINAPNLASKEIDFDMENDEMILTASILKHSDVMINMFSTMIIEAAIFDLPSINVCIKDKYTSNNNKTRQDIMVEHRQTHSRRVMDTGGVSTVYTMNELFDVINNYLSDRTLHQAERKLIVQNEAGPYKGDAGNKIGKHILGLLGN